MRKNFLCKLLTIGMLAPLALGISGGAYASSHSERIGSQLRQSLATAQQKHQFSFITKKLSQSGLPKNLALIPVIETHYRIRAVSGKGAAGLWQLMPATAKQYGVSNRARFQLGPSTGAALNYFKALHKRFRNWEFAIAAYNAGDGRVQKALREKPHATSVQQLNLPKETKQYVKKFYALRGQLKTYSL